MEPILIAALGDSTTAGTPGYRSPVEAPPDGEGNVESQFAYWLVEQHPHWRVLNRGVDGERSDEVAARFERDVLSRQPHVLVVIAGVNDVYQGRPIEHTKKHLRWIYDRAAAAGIPVVAGSILPYNTATADQNARMKAINRWIAGEAARDPNLTFVDTRAAVAARGNPNRLASSPDDLHPDVEGYRKVAATVGPVVDAVLAQPKVSADRAPE
ncbi:MAG TPA: SGNH/GDSL hydrolase family protein [Vicinamibacterales bacterium]|nr:SGNH/GDSL hydrolase family protein [Vicinamibacterales bacterium]